MQTPNTMRIMRRHVMRPLMVALLAGAAVGCDKTLTVEPTTEVEESPAIIDAASARAGLAGALRRTAREAVVVSNEVG